MPAPRPSANTGLTLLEVVMVVALLGLIGGAITVRWVAPLRVARINGTVERWLAIDQFLRSTTSHQSATLSLVYQDQRWVAMAHLDTKESIGRWEFDPRLEIVLRSWKTADPMRELEKIESVFFESSGGTRDYQIAIREGSISKTLRIAGGTGEAQED